METKSAAEAQLLCHPNAAVRRGLFGHRTLGRPPVDRTLAQREEGMELPVLPGSSRLFADKLRLLRASPGFACSLTRLSCWPCLGAGDVQAGHLIGNPKNASSLTIGLRVPDEWSINRCG